MTKKSLFFSLVLILSLVLLLTACKETQTTPTEQNSARITASARGENAAAPVGSDLPTGKSTHPRTSGAAEESTTQNRITREEATSTVLAHAGLTDVTLQRIETDLDRERGITVYEVDFDHGGYEYEYILNAETGEILFHTKERDWD